MNSLKIKSKELLTQKGKSIAQIVVLPENNKIRLYVAWENLRAAEDGFMGFFKSRELVTEITPEAIKKLWTMVLILDTLKSVKKNLKRFSN